MKWRQRNDKPKSDGYYFIKEGESGGGRYYFEVIGGGQWRWHEYSNCVGDKHHFEWLDESLPASIDQEAERLYPIPESATHNYKFKADLQRSAHITCARQYTDTIEKLRAENSKMRKALEEIAQKYADAEVMDDIGQFVFEMGELATSALNK